MTEHVHENLDRYLAGDLTTVEREQIERHLAACESCKQALADTLRLEQTMNSLFAEARPDTNLDDRIIQHLAKEPVRKLRRPPLWRFVGAAAAVLVVGLIGAAVQAIGDADSPLAKMVSENRASKPSAYFGAIGGTVIDESESMNTRKKSGGELAKIKGERESRVDAENAEKYASVLKALIVKDATDKTTFSVDQGECPDGSIPDPQRGKQGALSGLNPAGTLTPSQKQKDVLRDALDLNKLKIKFDEKDSFYRDAPKQVALAKRYYDDKKQNDALTKMLEEVEKAAEKPRKIQEAGSDQDKAAKEIEEERKSKLYLPPLPPTPPPPTLTPQTTPSYFETPPIVPVTQPNLPGDDKPGDKKGNGDGKKGPGESKGESPKDGEVPDGKSPSNDKRPDPKVEPKKQPPPDEPPLETNRKIIRTGEMEFEIDSFDKAVDNVTRLVTGIKGGFVATINSDKLPNGKMKGAIVVRMPPQYLDRFVLDLRRELAKSGELKNQRIISLDVTKQYTDIESRLRAARTMEDRLIQIIKIGKGEIKDLVAAERELGVWRTKIEEMEGEIRYYANQVSLSTLTIQLYEKEILAPTALVVSESVRMRLEVDDVARAHKTAMDLVEKLDGRITRSELKQHMAGQLQSILCADIPPKHKDAFRDALKKLGLVSLHEENQSQHTEGGIGKSGALKPRQDDVHFDITMHNTANIAPSRSTNMKVATTDVPAAYAKLLDEIVKADGQVRDGKLNEQDRLNVHAFLDFNVAPAKKPQIDKVLEAIGPVLERVNNRAPINQLSSERKFGYVVTLRDFASIAPSKAVFETIAAVDVPAAFARVQEAVVKAKGQIASGTLNEQDKVNVNAQIDFTVFTEEKPAIDTLIKDLGVSLSRNNLQAPLSQLSTAKKFGYTLILRDFASIPASKGVIEVIAAVDVPAAFAKLQDEIAKAKGRITAGTLNEQDKTNINAQIDFTVFTEEKPAIDTLLKDLGVSLSRTNIQTPINQLSTSRKFGYTLLVRDFAFVPASKAAELKIAVTDVPTSFAKLVDAIKAAKGHLDAKLNEKDKNDITAHFAFTVPIEEKPKIDELLGKVGTVLSRNDLDAPANLLPTDKKFGYTIDLRDFAAIPPSQSSNLTIAASNVPGNYVKLTEAITKAKGQIRTAKLDEKDKLNISAKIEFTVPSAEKPAFEKLLDDMGTMLSRINEQAPATVLPTDRKYGYAVDLRDFANIPAREAFIVQVAMTDVPAAFREFQEAIARAKGWISIGDLVEDNKVKTDAQLKFDVPTAEKANIERLLKSGTILSRTRNQVGVNELATDQKVGYRVTLKSSSSMLPREKVSLKLEVTDVDARSADLKVIVLTAKGRVIDSGVEHYENGQAAAVLVLEVPAASQDEVIRQIKGKGKLVSQTSKRNAEVPENELTTSQLIVTLAGSSPIVPTDEGLGASMHKSLYLSFRILTGIVMALIVGLSAIVPLVLLVWIGFKAYAIVVGSSMQPLPSLAPATGSKLVAEEEKPADSDPSAKS
jgi:Domain of unknown function (DUF4349)/Putative zinc-finger